MSGIDIRNPSHPTPCPVLTRVIPEESYVMSGIDLQHPCNARRKARY